MSIVDELRADPALAMDGIATATVADVTVVLVDPDRHPLEVWTSTAPAAFTYGWRGRGAGVVATNGPMMGRRVRGIGQVGRRTIAAGVACGGAAGALLAAVPGRRTSAIARVAAAGAGGMLGAIAGAGALLRGWSSCGQVVRSGRRSEPTFDGEGPRHAHIARTGPGFAGVVIGHGHPPRDAVTGMGGLIRLVSHGAVATDDAEWQRRRDDRPAVGWGTLPIGPGEGLVLIAAGARSGRSIGELAELMTSLGVADAVATDPSGCVLLAAGGEHLLPPPSIHRRAIQRFGLCCGPPR